ncbi:peptidase S8 and S53 subtilisin kexin sedolisin [Actinoplanes sp. N902-109]|nr:peptidase S8 and S53 subtilisin kexin sedolisin [Actinoplanes sp. N902-109]
MRRQVVKLTDANTDESARQQQNQLVQRILQRQRTAATAQATPFLHLPLDNAGDRVSLVASGELVVDADPATLDALGPLLSGYQPADRHGRSPHRRTRVFRAHAKTAEQLRADASRLRSHNGVEANVNTIVPLGYVTKGDSYPGSTVAPAAFATNGATAPVRVAIIDTGITAEQRTDGWDSGVIRAGTDPVNVLAPLDRIDWFAGHGTFATGIVRQIAPDCDVAVYRFTTTDGLGTDEAAADMMIQAAEDANGERLIINASFGTPAIDGVPPLAIQEAINHITEQHPSVLIIASAGNDGRDQPLYPAAFPDVVAVGALNSDLTPASFTNHGTWVDCAAVGVGVISTFVEGKLPPEPGIGTDITFGANSWATWSGTSFSAPQITGAVAALCGEDPALTPRQALDQLFAGRPTAPGLGKVIHILPGTPL